MFEPRTKPVPVETAAPAAGLPRRRLLFFSFAAAVGALLVSVAGVSLSFLKPPRPTNSYGGQVYGPSLAELPEVGREPILVPEGRYWLVHDPEGISALHSSCTHLDCRFSWDVQKQVFVCPCHGSEFDRRGTVLKGPATRSLDRFRMELVDQSETVLRGAAADSGAAVPVADLLAPPADPGDADDSGPAAVSTIRVRVDTSAKLPGIVGGRG